MVTPLRWLLLLVSLPPHPSRHRVAIWRKLRRLGAVTLGAAWILPDTPDTLEAFQWLVQEIRGAGGSATLARADRIETMTDDELRALFHRARAPEYEALIAECRALLARLDRGRDRSAVARVQPRVDGLRRELDRVRRIDHLGSPLGARAAQVCDTLGARLAAVTAGPRPRRSRRRGLPPPGSVWVTRPRPHVDRIASAWLIKRFIDRDARFDFADAADADRKGVPFDVLGADFGHHGEDCTMETLLKRSGITDRRLRAIAEMVHDADLQDGKFGRSEAPGVDATLRGVLATTDDDQEALERGMAIFDGLYAAAAGAAARRGMR